MLSKNDIKFIRSLEQVKYRRKHQSFVAEGRKVINEFIDSGARPKKIFTCSKEDFIGKENLVEVNEKELKQISTLMNPQGSLAIFDIPDHAEPTISTFESAFGLVCDCIQDPGNLGTIIRIADWFDIPYVITSQDTVDAYNPKVIQASMGSLARVKVASVDLNEYLKDLDSIIPLMAALLDGKNLYQSELPKNGLLVLGNESKGISESISKMASLRLMIPRMGGAESLNVAVSAGIFCAELRRPKN